MISGWYHTPCFLASLKSTHPSGELRGGSFGCRFRGSLQYKKDCRFFSHVSKVKKLKVTKMLMIKRAI